MQPLPERDPHRPHVFFDLRRGKQDLGAHPCLLLSACTHTKLGQLVDVD